MFFPEDDINEELLCQKCECKFNDPRILPCGQSFCQLCIEELMANESNDRLKCPHCSSEHQPADRAGFPSNIVLVKLLKKRSVEVSRGETVKQFQNDLKRIEAKIEAFESAVTR